jgi:hypothetical protein
VPAAAAADLQLQVVLLEFWLLQHPPSDHHCSPASCPANFPGLTWEQNQQQTLLQRQQQISLPHHLSCHQQLTKAQLLNRRQKHTQSQLLLPPLPLLLQLPQAATRRECPPQDSALEEAA